MFQPYETVAGYASDEFVERKSRFIGHIAPVKDEAEALDFLSRIRAEHREATHNVFAYILRESGVKRMSDDGSRRARAVYRCWKCWNGKVLPM